MGNEFSVLMLVYGGDRPAHFDAALRSIAAQPLPPAEIVLVVDGPIPAGTEGKDAKKIQCNRIRLC